MCLSAPKAPEVKPPAPPPPPPKPIEFGSASSQGSSKKKTSARNSLSIPLNMGGISGGTGLGIPK